MKLPVRDSARGSERPGLRTLHLRLARGLKIALPLAVGLVGSGLLALILVGNADAVPACEVATAAAPDFESAPFAFDPEERAQAFVQAMAHDDFETAYDMLALERLGRTELCEADLEEFWRVVAADHPGLIAIEPFFAVGVQRGIRPLACCAPPGVERERAIAGINARRVRLDQPYA